MSVLRLELELARAKDAGDPYAFRWGLREYIRLWDNERVQPTSLAWTDTLSADLQALARPEPPPEHLARLGAAVRAFALGAGWAEEEARLLTALQSQQPVEINLRFHAAELFALPWEALPVEGANARLGELPQVLLRYAWPGTRPAPEAPAPRPAATRVLLAWSAAAGEVDAGAHAQALQEAARAADLAWDAEHDQLRHTQLAGLQARLGAAQAQGRPFCALHLLAHGAPLPGGGFGLALDGPEGVEVVDGPTLASALGPFASSLRLVVVSACSSGDAGPLGARVGSVAQALHRAGVESVLASRLPLSMAGSALLARSIWGALLVELRSLEDATRRATQALRTGPHPLAAVALQLHGAAPPLGDTRPLVLQPYRGLLPFRREHRRFFFGRDAEVQQVLEDLDHLHQTADPAHPPLLLIIGASGTGKSSLVMGGVLPALGQLGPVVLLRPGADPLGALEQALATGPPGVLVVDQLEELFTHGAPEDTQSAFLQRVWGLAEGGARVLITLRVDWLSRCAGLRLSDGRSLEQIAYDEGHRVFVAQLAGEALRAAIERPAATVGLLFEAGLAERLYNEVCQEPGALPLAQHALDLLWQQRQGPLLTHAACEAMGGAIGALQHQADAALAALPADQRPVARSLLVRLVRFVGEIELSTRRRLALHTLRPADPARAARLDAVVAALVDRRLLVRDEGVSGEATLEIAHEALIRRWPALRGWLVEDRERVQAIEHLGAWVEEQARFPAFLLRGEQLSAAQRTRARYGDELSAPMLALVEVSERTLAEEQAAEARRQRRERRMGQGLLWGGLGFSALAVGLLIWAKLEAQEASEARAAAEVAKAESAAERAAAERAEAEAAAERARADERTADAERAEAASAAAQQKAYLAQLAAADADARAKDSARAARAAQAQAAAEAAAARTERERADQALARLQEAQAQADLALHLRVAGALLNEDPTLAAALLAEREQDATDPAWRRLALTTLTYPLAEAVYRPGLGELSGLTRAGDQLVLSTRSGRFAVLTADGTLTPVEEVRCAGPGQVRAGGERWVALCADGQAWGMTPGQAPVALHGSLPGGTWTGVGAAVPHTGGQLLLAVGTPWPTLEGEATRVVEGVVATSLVMTAQGVGAGLQPVSHRPMLNTLDLYTWGSEGLVLSHTAHLLTGREHLSVVVPQGARGRLGLLLPSRRHRRLYRSADPILSLGLSAEGWGVVGERGGRVRLLRPSRWRTARTLTRHAGAVEVLEVHGQHIVSGAADGTVRVSQPSRPHRLGRPTTGLGVITSLEADPGGQWLAVGQQDGALVLLDLDGDGGRPVPLRGHTDAVSELVHPPGSGALLSASRDGSLRAWDTTGLHTRVALPSAAGVVTELGWDGGRLWIGAEDRSRWSCAPPGCAGLTPERWQEPPPPPERGVTTFAQALTLQDLTGAPERTALDSGGLHLRVSEAPAPGVNLRVVQVREGEGPWRTVVVSKYPLRDLALVDRQLVVLGPLAPTVWSIDDATPSAQAPGEWRGLAVARLRAHRLDPGAPPVDAHQLAVQPQGTLVLTYGPDASPTLWQLGWDHLEPGPALERPEGVEQAAFSPNGQQLAGLHADGSVSVWDANTGEVLYGTGSIWSARTLAWTPQGDLLLGCADGQVLYWAIVGPDGPRPKMVGSRPETFFFPTPVGALPSPVQTLTVSPDGMLVAAAGESGGAELWYLHPQGGPSPAYGLPHTEGWITAMAFSPDGQWLALGTDLGELVSVHRDWLVDPLGALREATTACVPPAERAALLGEEPGDAERAERACQAGWPSGWQHMSWAE